MRNRRSALLLVAGALALAGCSGSSSSAKKATTTAKKATTTTIAEATTPKGTLVTDQITITDGAFTPRTITVKKGTMITLVNKGKGPHTVTADDGSFDTGPIKAGETLAKFFATPGTFSYHCTVDKTMKGTIVVTG